MKLLVIIGHHHEMIQIHQKSDHFCTNLVTLVSEY